MISSQYTLGAFKTVCRVVGNLTNKEIDRLISILKEKDPKAIKGSPYQFNPEIMYEVFISDEACKRFCEKYGYKFWDQLTDRSEELLNRSKKNGW